MTSWRTSLRTLRPSTRPKVLMMPSWYATPFVDSVLFVVSALEHAGVQVIAHRGLLLGALRLQGVLPWDDDADLFTLGEDIGSLEQKLGPVLREHGFRLELREREHYFWAYPRTIYRFPLAGLTEIGLFTESRDARGRATFDAHEPRRRITQSELAPLRRMPFYGTYLHAPAESELAMQRMYGELASREAFARFSRPEIDAECESFWARARPLEGALDWPAICARFRARSASAYFQLTQAPASLWWLGNRAHWLTMDALRVLAGGER